MLKLPKLPDRTPVKLTITINPELHQQLQSYAALYRDTYGTPEPVADLIPYMLDAFLYSDRGYAKAQKEHRPSGQAPVRGRKRREISFATIEEYSPGTDSNFTQSSRLRKNPFPF